MKTFTLKRVDGTTEDTPYVPLHRAVGEVAHVFALHRGDDNGWQLSDIASGAKLIDVHGVFKGMQVHSSAFSQNEIEPLAKRQLTDLIARVGADRFNEVIAKAIVANIKGE